MTQFLPTNLLTLFAARDPIPYLPPVTKLSHEKPTHGYSGINAYLKFFEDPKETPPPTKYETREERVDRKRREKQEQIAYKLEQEIAHWNPAEYEKCTGDPFRTLFVGRINYDTSESKLRREFELYGPVKKVYLALNKKTEKPRGYAFVEYEHERDMHAAYKDADGKKIDGKRVLVDVERGRTVKGWLPRRFGGGLGGTRIGGPDQNVKISGREDADRDRSRAEAENRDRGEERRLGSRNNDKVERRGDRDRDRSKDKDNKVDRRGGGGRDRDRDRSRDKVDRREPRERDLRDRSKDMDKDKDKVERRGRERSKDKGRRDRDKDKDKSDQKRDKSREKNGRGDRKRRHRSKSRDKGERKRDRKDRDRDRVKAEDDDKIHVKEEPADDYPVYDSYGPYEDEEGTNTVVKEERERERDEEEEEPNSNHRPQREQEV